MSSYTIPALDAPAKEWGQLAVSIPGWRWIPKMLAVNFDGPVRVESVVGSEPGILRRCRWTGELSHADIRSGPLPDPDDRATERHLLQLLGPRRGPHRVEVLWCARWNDHRKVQDGVVLRLWQGSRVLHESPQPMPLGRACIGAAAGCGRWPGGE